MYRIILDAMGGDHAPHEIILGAVEGLRTIGDIEITLVGKQEVILEELNGITVSYDRERLKIVDARETIEMAEAPVSAIRTKKDSSLVVGMKLAAEGQGDVFITAGSTGATVAGATLIVRRVKGVERPALAPIMPTAKGQMMIVDCGANVDCRPTHLQQFAVMGSVYMEKALGIKNPRVGLLNNGSEEEKGNELTKKAYQLLKQVEGINFIGNVEGRELPLGGVDVVVCDGFAGNIIMKFYEGCGKAIFSMLKEELMSSFRSKMGALLAKPAFKHFAKKMDYSEYGGALMLGVNAGVVKAHGSSKAKAIRNTIEQARDFAAAGIVEQIKEDLSRIRVEEETEK